LCDLTVIVRDTSYSIQMNTELKIITGTIVASIIIIGAGVFYTTRPAPEYTSQELLTQQTAVLGAQNTKVQLVEFSDFQCPACGAYKPAVDSILKEYKNEISFGYRHFPLMQHPFAEYAAYASEAAGKQGKFWEMYDYLFARQATLSKEVIDSGAESMGLDMTQYRKDVDSSEIKAKVEKDKADGAKFGVNSTPTFFLNGKKLQLTGPDSLKQAVEQAVRENN
jgi:protein-disulfide isomerase